MSWQNSCENSPEPSMSTPLVDSDTTFMWRAAQEELSKKVISTDDNSWSHFFTTEGYKANRDLFCAGADISFSEEKNVSVGTLTIVKLCVNGSKELIYSYSRKVSVKYPYVSSFLGFREAPVISTLLQDLPERVRNSIDCLLVDGNGIFHPRKAGLACQVGLSENIPCIGVSKTLLCIDGLNEKDICEKVVSSASNDIAVTGASGFVWAKALLAGNAQRKPIYISVGHRVSLFASLQLVKALCDYRVPAPIRYADIHSRAWIRGEHIQVFKTEEFL